MLFGTVLEVLFAMLRKCFIVCAGVLTEGKKADLETVSERYCPLAKKIGAKEQSGIECRYHVSCGDLKST